MFVEEVDDLIVDRLAQGADDELVRVVTRDGDITLQDRGVTSAGGDITFYAGRGALLQNAAIDSNGGKIALTAEAGDLVLGAGVDANATNPAAAGGTISLRAVQGSIRTDVAASNWLRVGGAPASFLEWVLTHGKFTVDAVTGTVVAANLTDEEIAFHGVTDGVTTGNGLVLRSAGGAYLQTVGGADPVVGAGRRRQG